jgi:prepilin-type N-terminal cleavage/methylation domain-containing protein
MKPWPNSTGFTLAELIVVMAIMSVGFVVATVSLSRVTASSTTEGWSSGVSRARRTAALEGAAVVRADSAGHGRITFLPDGRAIGEGLDPLTGRRKQDR